MAGLYALATLAPWTDPIVIPEVEVDGWVPFVPAAAWVYITYYLLQPALIVMCAGRPGFATVFGASMACGLANALIYVLVPTSLPGQAGAPTGSLLAFIQGVDTTLGAFPSGHVSLPAAIAVAAWLVARAPAAGNREPGTGSFWFSIAAIFGIWALAIAGSTLLTRQHVLLDVVAGLAFGATVAASAVWAVRTVHIPTLAALLFEWSLIIAIVAVALRWWSVPLAIAAGLVISTRQHAILVLYHDAVHGLAAHSRRANDFLINTFVGVPALLPVHLYRALHLSHHAHLGEACDPERVLLYRGQPWAFRPLPAARIARQVAGDLFAWHGIVMIVRYFRERGPGGALRLTRTRAYPELVAQFALFGGAWVVAFVLWPVDAWHAALLWFVPFNTVTQLLQKIRSFAEHALEDVESTRSCSWSPGILGRLTIWPYNINYHREHHQQPGVPWDRLPVAFPAVPQRPGHALLAHLWSGATR